MQKFPMNILIVGGGIAGLSLALFLKKAGISPVVVEQAPALRTEGYMIDFFGSGWDAGERLGIIPQIQRLRYPIETIAFADKRGTPYYTVPVKKVKDAFSDRYAYLLRSDLEKILFDEAQKNGINIQFGASVSGMRQTPSAVHVTFADGTEESFDIVVGADGIRSAVRTMVFGDGQWEKFLGCFVAAFHAPNMGIGSGAVFQHAPYRSVGMYPLSRERVDVACIFRSPLLPRLSTAEIRALLASIYAKHTALIHALSALPANAPIFFDAMTQIRMASWSRGRVVLLGDAAWCLTLLAGQGAHMAMAGAAVLAQELAKQADHGQAFAAYEKFLRPHIEQKQKTAARFGKIFFCSPVWFHVLRKLILRAAMGRFGTRTAAQFGAKSILREYR